ncbi:zinc finger B-box domain-containing protein 1 isoform X2 [Nannospalax galili]|uniref:zinc finger B-box domain-containing protein 1 isoform X2 n=1 Tax=Nannospalax galili TaxID=1026970 RepID=UPI0004ED0D71|nr:zinc finger B-box domain-containing protein 1 isoform X2 [Nannospalax galili]
MNTRDFVVVPWGKPGNSVKLKYKHTQELRMEKIQLELENQEMQKKLQEFQSTWNKGKEEMRSSGYHWKSGNRGKLGHQSHVMSQNRGNAIKFSAGNLKLKLLKEQIQEPAKPPLNYKMASAFGSEKSKMKRKLCGQCENQAALLVCLECGEDYCSGCFSKMHQKGAMKLHRTTLLQAKSQMLSSVLDVAHQFIKEANPPQGGNTSTEDSNRHHHKQKSLLVPGSISEVEAIATEGVECGSPGDRTLCERSFDKETPAQSFADAVSQWTTSEVSGDLEEKKQQNLHAAKPDSVEECEVQTNLKIWTEPINIEFTEDSLSYMEKLWLKKYRRTPQEQLRSLLPDTLTHSHATTSETQRSQNENADDSDVEETKVKYPPLFMPTEKLTIERPQPSLTIVELDGTNEAEFEEPGSIVPYRVELADAESQLSSTFPDYQKNCFSCENDFYQHLVFNKGKTDLLSLCLTNSSTYYKDDFKARNSNTDSDDIVDSEISHEFGKIQESSSFERNVKEKNIDPENGPKSDDSCMPLGSKDSSLSTDLVTSSIPEDLFQNTPQSVECNHLCESPNFIDSKTTKSLLLLREIALRKKPVNERYQGLEKFFIVGKNEGLNVLPSANIGCSRSCSEITFAGQKSQRPSTVNLPVHKSIQKGSNFLSPPYSRARSAAAQSQFRAASEISEIEYVDIADQNEPFLDNAADQQTLDSVEKELNVLGNLEDPSEKLHSLTSEESPSFKHHLVNLSEMSTDFLNTSCVKGPYGAEELSSSKRDSTVQSLLSLDDYRTDEEEEDFLDKQHVVTLPWAKSIS